MWSHGQAEEILLDAVRCVFTAPAATQKSNIKLEAWEKLSLTTRFHSRNIISQSSVLDENPIISGSHQSIHVPKNAATNVPDDSHICIFGLNLS